MLLGSQNGYWFTSPLRRAAEGYNRVVRRIQFSEAHPHVHIEMVTAPCWHWTATWIRHDGTQVTKTYRELRGLLDQLDGLDWDEERRRRPPPRRRFLVSWG